MTYRRLPLMLASFLALAPVLAPMPALAQSTEKLGTFGNWQVFRTDTGCGVVKPGMGNSPKLFGFILPAASADASFALLDPSLATTDGKKVEVLIDGKTGTSAVMAAQDPPTLIAILDAATMDAVGQRNITISVTVDGARLFNEVADVPADAAAMWRECGSQLHQK